MIVLPLKVAAIMRDFKPSWFVAGGWAIDLYLGNQLARMEILRLESFVETKPLYMITSTAGFAQTH